MYGVEKRKPHDDLGVSMTRDINLLALVKGEERYALVYDDDSVSAAIQQLGRWAANAELSFTWFDAATLCQRIRKEYIITEVND